LKPEDEGRWLDPRADLPSLNQLLRPYPAAAMEAYPVSRAVNDPANDRPELINPAPALSPQAVRSASD
jgi:putative SOS response-associated peptidase YedK